MKRTIFRLILALPLAFVLLLPAKARLQSLGAAEANTALQGTTLTYYPRPTFAQAPGWSRGQQSLAISYDECMRRAPAALSAEGYRRDDQPGGNFAVGIKDVHTAVIICSPAPDAKMLVHIVVASNGDGGGTERQRLQAQMERPGSVSGGCGLGVRWDEAEEGWTAVWTRRGNSNVFDVESRKGGMFLTAVQTINISGNRVSVIRTNASDGNNCEMEGTIDRDGVTVTGKYYCRSGGPYIWRATIRCQR